MLCRIASAASVVYLIMDESNGYDSVAEAYIRGRGRAVEGTGVAVARAWANTFGRGATVLDLGCGTGIPVTKALVDAGLNVYAVDASPALVAEFQRNFPNVSVTCESVVRSPFFDRRFDGIIAVGLVFLLSEADQRILISKMAGALNPGGKLLFTAPRQTVRWIDVMTGRESRSLGTAEYNTLMYQSGLSVVEVGEDEGGNYYFAGVKLE